MSCCSKKIFKICEPVGTCSEATLKLPYTGLPNGAYKIVLQFLNSLQTFIVDAVDGTLTIPTNSLNENFYYEGKVYDENGTLVLFNTDYDTFSFQTTISIHHGE